MLAALLIGFLGSMHCVGMCGPLVLAMPFGGTGGGMPVSRMISYHSGRLLTYAMLGIAVGLIGGGLRFFFIQQWISIASGVLLLVLYFLPKISGSSLFPSLSAAWNREVVVRMRKMLRPTDDRSSTRHLFGIGLVNGLLPCGLVYMALIGAVAQPTVWGSALFMAIFGVGTSPALTGVIMANRLVSAGWRSSFSRVIPLFVVIVAALLILRGMGLGIPYISPADERNCCHSPEAAVLEMRAPGQPLPPTACFYDQLSNTAPFPV